MSWRKWLATSFAALLFLTATSAQGPQPTQRPAEAADPRIDLFLARWAKDVIGVQSMAARIISTKEDPVFKRKQVLVGTVKYQRPDRFALFLQSQTDPQQYEKFVCNGTHLFLFQPAQKQIIPVSLKHAGQLPDDGPLPFLVGMRADIAKKRYQIKITRQEKGYTDIQVTPLFERDMADFTVAAIRIIQGDPIPQQIVWLEPNKTQVIWELQNVQKNVRIPSQELEAPKLQPGWTWGKDPTLANSPAASKTRVVRPQGQ